MNSTVPFSSTPMERLNQEIAVCPALHHPFLLEFSKGNLTETQIQTFALQHYQLVRIFVTYLENLLHRLRNEEARNALAEILQDEYASSDFLQSSHPALYRRFMRAINLTEKMWETPMALPETKDFICGHTEITLLFPPEIGLGAIGPAHEFAIPAMFSYIVKGLKKFGLSQSDCTYFYLHIEQDKKHQQLLEQALTSLPEEQIVMIREGALRSLELRHRFWDGLHRAVFE